MRDACSLGGHVKRDACSLERHIKRDACSLERHLELIPGVLLVAEDVTRFGQRAGDVPRPVNRAL